MKEHTNMSEPTNVQENLHQLKSQIPPHITIVAVSKFQPIEKIQQAYNAGHRDFGENYVQELKEKYEQLPKDIRWHFVGHLQSNKVKYIAPFIHLIHGVDDLKLLKEINKQALRYSRTIHCLLQVRIAQEETKFGFAPKDILSLLHSTEFKGLQHLRILGLMGMATNTNNTAQIKKEFQTLKALFDTLRQDKSSSPTVDMQILSMGMSQDYKIAIECGSTMIRIGTMIFGEREKL